MLQTMTAQLNIFSQKLKRLLEEEHLGFFWIGRTLNDTILVPNFFLSVLHLVSSVLMKLILNCT